MQGIEDALYDTSPEDQLSWLHSLHVKVDALLKDIPALKLEVSGTTLLWVLHLPVPCAPVSSAVMAGPMQLGMANFAAHRQAVCMSGARHACGVKPLQTSRTGRASTRHEQCIVLKWQTRVMLTQYLCSPGGCMLFVSGVENEDLYHADTLVRLAEALLQLAGTVSLLPSPPPWI